MKPILSIFILALILLPSAPAGASHPPWNGKVVEVLSGDTISVMRDGKAVKVRLAEVACPALGQPYGPEAEQRTRGLCLGEVVTVWPVTFDLSGQAWAHVILRDGNCLNDELVRAGLAWQDKRFSRRANLAAMEEKARRAKRGLWSDPKSVPPWRWRQEHEAK